MKIAIFVAVVVTATTAFANLPQPILSMTLNKPFGQIFAVTIANVGSGVASTIVLAAPQPGPEIDIAYKGERSAEGRTPANPIPADCSTVATGATQTRVCVLRAAPQPGEMPSGNHLVDLRRACDL